MFDSLPDDLFTFFPFTTLFKLAATSTNLKKRIIDNEEFWAFRCKRDYASVTKKDDQRWIDVYISNYANVYVCGDNNVRQLWEDHKGIFQKPTIIDNRKFKDMCISAHTIAIDLHNNVWTWGSNDYGQLGHIGNSPNLVKYPDSKIPIKARQITVGYSCSGLIDMNDDIWVCGWNKNNKLRIAPEYITKFIQFLGLKAKQIAFGSHHTVILDLKNNVWTCGSNESGQLGIGTIEPRSLNLVSGFKAKQIAAGYHITFLIDMEDNVWVCGDNFHGQLGLGNNDNRMSPVKIPDIKARQISIGSQHTILINLENNVWVCGNNDLGQLGFDQEVKNRSIFIQKSGIKAKQVSAGNSYSVIIDMENNVWECGDGFYGIKGLGNFGLKQVEGIKAAKVSTGHDSTALITML